MKKLLSLLITIVLFSCSQNETEISKESFQGDWPFIVDSGIIGCEDGMIYFRTNEKSYSVNGYATKKFEAIKEILIPKTSPEVMPVSIGDISDFGKKLCD